MTVDEDWIRQTVRDWTFFALAFRDARRALREAGHDPDCDIAKHRPEAQFRCRVCGHRWEISGVAPTELEPESCSGLTPAEPSGRRPLPL